VDNVDISHPLRATGSSNSSSNASPNGSYNNSPNVAGGGSNHNLLGADSHGLGQVEYISVLHFFSDFFALVFDYHSK
jgi:hypothetical protein